MKIRPVIGIDLGTTNCALAFTEQGPVEIFPIQQLVHANEERAEPLLPSFLYLDPSGPFAGLYAQRKGLENAGRLVASAKSWLSHTGMDRTAPMLPIHAPEGVEKVSPVEASRHYLAHLKKAWNAQDGIPFDDHQVLVTVPASFDNAARNLTLQAAEQAGYRDVVLLEEPQAAFYSWIEKHPQWRELVGVGDLILVVDIGGGTTDFSLIAVREEKGQITLDRVAVGDHILLGGDNIDTALAHQVAQKLPKLDAMRMHALIQHCRDAKEKLLEEGSQESEANITLLGRGTGLVGGTLKAKLSRDAIDRLLLDGFLPAVPRDAEPDLQPPALSEVGLPYATDPAITKHLAHFLRRQSAEPTHVLFNGGVLRAGLVRDRVIEVLNSWLAKPVIPLAGGDLMHAVARGAAYYGLARQGQGIRVRGGVPHTYYIGIETAMPAVPGMKPPLKALAVVPFGMEEGNGHAIPNRRFSLRVGDRAQFRFFQSERKDEPPGTLLEDVPADLQEIAPIEVSLSGENREVVTVTVESLVNETGMLELWFASADGRRWKVEFNVRPKQARR